MFPHSFGHQLNTPIRKNTFSKGLCSPDFAQVAFQQRRETFMKDNSVMNLHPGSLTHRLPFLHLFCPLALPSSPPASPSRCYPTPSRRSHIPSSYSSFSAAHSAWSHRGVLLAVCCSSSQPILLRAFFLMSHLGCYASTWQPPPFAGWCGPPMPSSFSPRFSFLSSILIHSPFQISL